MGDFIHEQIDYDEDIPNPKSQSKGQTTKSSMNSSATKQIQNKDQNLKSNLFLSNPKENTEMMGGMKNSKSMVTANDLKNIRSLQQNDFATINRGTVSKTNNFRITPNSKAINNSFSFESPNNYETIKSLVIQDSGSKGYTELEEENKKLRNYLRDMNETLNKLFERQGVARLTATKKNSEFEHKPIEDQLRTHIQEISNNEKIIKIKTEEFQKVKARLGTLMNAGYLIEVQEKIDQGKKQIEEIQRENKEIKLKNTVTGKDLDNIENVSGAPQNIVMANQMQKELLLLKKKNDKIKSENSKFEEQTKDQLKRIAELEAQIEKLEALANHHGIELSMNADKQKCLSLMKEVNEHENLLKAVSKRNDKYLENFYHREIEELKLVRMRDEEHLAKLEQMMDEQGVSLKDLLSRESLQSDKSVRDLITKLKVYAAEPKQDQSSTEKKIAKPSPNNKAKFLKKTIQTKNDKDELAKGFPITSPVKKTSPKSIISKKPPTDQVSKAQGQHLRNSSQELAPNITNSSQELVSNSKLATETQLIQETPTKEHEQKLDQEDLDFDEEALLREEEEIRRQEKLLQEQQEQEALKKQQQEIEAQLQARNQEEEEQPQQLESERLKEEEDSKKVEHDKTLQTNKFVEDHAEHEDNQDAELKELEKEHPSLKLPDKTQKDKIVKLNNDLDDSPISNEKFKSSRNQPLKLPDFEGAKKKEELIKKPVEYQPQLKLNFDHQKSKEQAIKQTDEEDKEGKLGDSPTEKVTKLESENRDSKPNYESKKSLKKPEEISHIKGENSVFINPTKSNTNNQKKEEDNDGLLFDADDQGELDHKKKTPTHNEETKNEVLTKKETTKEKEVNNVFFEDLEDG